MADTYTTECQLCHSETDCINNLCLECSLNEQEYFNKVGVGRSPTQCKGKTDQLSVE